MGLLLNVLNTELVSEPEKGPSGRVTGSTAVERESNCDALYHSASGYVFI